MSAFGGKADMPGALHMSAFDPKRTLTTRPLFSLNFWVYRQCAVRCTRASFRE